MYFQDINKIKYVIVDTLKFILFLVSCVNNFCGQDVSNFLCISQLAQKP